MLGYYYYYYYLDMQKTCTHIAGGKKILINTHIHSDITQRVVNIIIVIPQRIPW